MHLVSVNNSNSDRPPGFEDRLAGYHSIRLEKPYGIDTVGEDMCALTGYTANELRENFGIDCSVLVCPDDRERYLGCLDALAEEEQSQALEYKVLKKDGSLLPVCSIATSRRREDGKMYAYFVTTDASDLPEQRSVGDVISSLLPFGYLQCTFEKYPKITYINQALRDYLGMGKTQDLWEQSSQDNIYFLVPFEEREMFRQYLQKAEHATHPIRAEHHMFRDDGSLVHMAGWLSMVPGSGGRKEYALVYRELEDTVVEEEQVQDTSYFPVLKRSYNAIFVLNLETSMVECIHGLTESPIGPLAGIQMTLESAKHVCLNNYIYQEDKAMMTDFLNQISDPKDDWQGLSVLQTEFRLKVNNGVFRFLGVAVHMDADQVLLCCRDVTHLTYSGAKDLESNTLHKINDWLDFLSTNNEGTIGMLMLDKNPQGCSLLYGSSSVLHYLGLDTEENAHRSVPPSLSECLSAANMSQSDWDELTSGKNIYLWSRSVPNAYQFQLTCKTYTRGERTLYIIWCSNNQLQLDVNTGSRRVFARTFGHFDLFIDNTPITFSSAKEKELMALLIDRNGGTLSPSEAISYLWEDEPADEHTSARYRKLAMGLKRTLEKYGIEDIIINHNGTRSIDTSAIRCDYYELLAGNVKYRQAFHNAYMSDYSWGEETLAALMNSSEDI